MTARTGRKLLKKVPVKIRDEILLMDINEIRELRDVLYKAIDDTYEYWLEYTPDDGCYHKYSYFDLCYGNTSSRTVVWDDEYDFHQNASQLIVKIATKLGCLATKEQCITKGAYKVYYNYNTKRFDYKFSPYDMSGDLIDTDLNVKEIRDILNDSDELLERFN